MSYSELFKILLKPWASVNEIMSIANCGKDSATQIRNNIVAQIRKENKEIPYSKKIIVPTEKVIEYLNLDVDYIKTMAFSEQEFMNCKTKLNASLSE